jgi:hypothetical protein
MLVFSIHLCELLPLSASLSFNSPPTLPCVNNYIVYTYTVCKGGGVWGSGPQTDKHLPQSPFTGYFFRHFVFPSLSLIFLRCTCKRNECSIVLRWNISLFKKSREIFYKPKKRRKNVYENCGY